MELGKIIGHKKDGSKIFVEYQNGQITIDVISESIIRLLNPIWMENYESVAIEGDKHIATDFDVVEDNGKLLVSTPKATLSMGDNLQLIFSNSNGVEMFSTYSNKRDIPQRLSEKDKRILESEGHSFMNIREGDYPVQLVFNRRDDDNFYGLGDKTGFLNKRDYAFENWNSDIPDIHHENMPALYKSIPFVIGKNDVGTYGMFFDNTFHSYMDFGKENKDYYFYGADDGNLDVYFFAGPKMVDVIRDYTYLTGRAPLPMLWTLGYHQCRWGYESADDIREIARAMRDNRIPCESVQYDIDYMKGYRVFTWDEENYGEPGTLFDELAKDGYKPVVIIDPGTKKDPGYHMYDQGIENDYFAHDKDGAVYENAVWPGTSTFPDFGRREVRQWWGQSHKTLTDMGVMGIWNDMNEPASFNGPLPMDVQFSVNDRLTNHAEAHNTYGHFMSRATYEGVKELTGKRPLVITRACYAGTQKYSAVWTGDNQSVWSHLKMLVPQLCNLGLSGMPIAGTDIGGFGGDSHKELMCRWIEAAAFSTFFRNHSAKGTLSQEPWRFDEETIAIYRKYVELHYQFLPYIYDLLYKGKDTGLGVMRPLVLHYEDDANTYNLNDEFLVGEDMLVCPVVDPGITKRLVYLPEGNWIDYWTGETHAGGTYIIKDAPLDTLPIFIKEGSIIPTYDVVQYVGEKEYDHLHLLWTGGDASYVHYRDNGMDFSYENGEYDLVEYKINPDGVLSTSNIVRGYDLDYTVVDVIKLIK